MKQEQFTPLRISASFNQSGEYIILTSDNERKNVASTPDLRLANLIVAAPNLYDGLRKAIDWLIELGAENQFVRITKLKSILSKANPQSETHEDIMLERNNPQPNTNLP